MAVPLISVVMPVYNGGQFLARALDSVLAQSLADFEVVVIDDGSTDGSDRVLAGYAAQDGRVVVHSQANQGVIPALNRGVGLARGEYIARMDADDISQPSRFQRQVDHLRGHPQVAVVGSALQFLDEGGPLPQVQRYPGSTEEVRSTLQRRPALAHPTVMVRRRAVLELGGYRPAFRHAEDYDLWLRISERFDLANLPDVLLYYRLHGSQVSARHAEQQVVSAIGARVAAAYRRRGEPDPTEGVELMTRETLHRMGVADDEIDDAILDDLVRKAHQSTKLSLPDLALQLVDEMESVQWPPRLERTVREESAWIRAKAHLAGRDLGESAKWLARAYWLRPGRLLTLAKSMGARLRKTP